jgi:excisionase family DNA binding protein
MSSVRKRGRRKRTTKRARIVGYTVPEVGALLKVSRNTVYDMSDRGELEYARAGRLIRILAGPFHEKYGAAIGA